jgi:hypothetical protein
MKLFKKVNLAKILAPEFRIHNKNACSSCENAFILSCQLLESRPSRNVAVFMGDMPAKAEPVEEIKVAFGNCCAGDNGFDKIISGCPPYPFDLKECLQSIEE